MNRLLVLALLLGTTSIASAVDDKDCFALKLSYGECYEHVDEELINKAPNQRTAAAIKDFLAEGASQNDRLIKLELAKASAKVQLERSILRGVTVGRARLFDKQEGSTPNAGGTTSAVSRGVVPSILSFAVENGAVARTERGTAATFRGNLLGVANMLVGAGQIPYCTLQSSCTTGTKLLDSLSFNVSFDPQRDAAGTTPVFTGSTRQIGAWGIRWDWRTRGRILDKKWLTDDNKVVRELASDYAIKFADVQESIAPNNRAELMDKYVARFQAADASGTKIQELSAAFLQEWVKQAREDSPKIDETLDASLVAQGAYIGARDEVLKKYLKGWNFALELNNIKPVQQPTYWTSRAILAMTFDKESPLTWTANAASSWYDIKPGIGTRTLRDLQLATDLSKKIHRSDPDAIDISMSLGYYMQWMAQNSLISIPANPTTLPGTSIPISSTAAALLNTKGAIHVAQARIVLSHASWPFSIPIAFNYSNRSELLPETKWKPSANIGLSFDFDKLLSAVR